MSTSLGAGGLMLAGHHLAEALDHVRRFCGLSWSGGPPEVWAFRYYDLIRTDPDRMDPVDVLAASAIHPGLSRDDLAWFDTNRPALDDWLAGVGVDVQLADANEAARESLVALAGFGGVTLTLLSKVLHRKRPHLVPLVDRHVVDRYRPVTGERRPLEAWPGLIEALAVDLERNAESLAAIRSVLRDELEVDVSALRVCDIAIWMEARS